MQKKLWVYGSHKFWQDIDRSVSYLVRDLITGRDVARLAVELRKAGVQKCTDSLIYKWSNPTDERLPSAKALFLLIKITENCAPLDSLNDACGLIGVPEGDFMEGVKHYTGEFERRSRMRPQKLRELAEEMETERRK